MLQVNRSYCSQENCTRSLFSNGRGSTGNEGKKRCVPMGKLTALNCTPGSVTTCCGSNTTTFA